MPDTLWELDRIAWSDLRVAAGTGQDVPRHLRALSTAMSPEQRHSVYENLRDAVAYSGLLREAAAYVVGPLYTLASTAQDDGVVVIALTLLENIAHGERHVSEDAELDDLVRAELWEGRALLYALIGHQNPVIRAAALDVLPPVEPWEERLRWAIDRLGADPHPRVMIAVEQALIELRERREENRHPAPPDQFYASLR